MEMSYALITLAKEAKANGGTLLIVGGAVRDSILGTVSKDIDLTGNLSVKDMEKICKSLHFKTDCINSKLGTIKISTKDGFYEYTTFRKEVYENNGCHTPSKVEFVDDVNIDCLRRDFKMNAIYFDILNSTIIDPLNGTNDVKHRLISTTLDPKITLGDDGLRILRAFRFQAKLGFRLDKNTKREIYKSTPLLKSISKERILEELRLTLCDDGIDKKGIFNYITMLLKTKSIGYIFSSTLSRLKMIDKQSILKTSSLNPSIRLVGFFVLILKNFLTEKVSYNHIVFTSNALLGHSGIKASKDIILCCTKILSICCNLENNTDVINASINYLTLSTPERSVVDCNLSKKAKTRLSDNISLVHDKNLPLGVHELNITATDLISEGIEKTYISKILQTLYNQVLSFNVSNEKNDLLDKAKEINDTFLKISKSIKMEKQRR